MKKQYCQLNSSNALRYKKQIRKASTKQQNLIKWSHNIVGVTQPRFLPEKDPHKKTTMLQIVHEKMTYWHCVPLTFNISHNVQRWEHLYSSMYQEEYL